MLSARCSSHMYRAIATHKPVLAASCGGIDSRTDRDIQAVVESSHASTPTVHLQTKSSRSAAGFRSSSVLSPSISNGINSHMAVRYAHTDVPTPDFSAYRHKDTKDPTVNDDGERRKTAQHAVSGAALATIAMGAKGVVHPLIRQWSASADVLALAKSEVNLADIPVGKNVVVKWRGKPLFVRHRTPEEIAAAQNTDVGSLRDPEEDSARVKDPEWLVVLGVCTHLGCVPIANQGNFDGYYCPCHGSHYDTSGRIRQGPAPLNLEVPPHEFDGDLLTVG